MEPRSGDQGTGTLKRNKEGVGKAFMPKALRINYGVNIMGRAGLFCTKPKLSAEVLIYVATSPEFCPL